MGSKPPRKVLCSLASGRHKELLEITRPTFEDYARRHGYDLVLSTTPPPTEGRPAAWAKVPFLRERLAEYDLVLWLDADVVIVDPDEDIAEHLDDDRFLHLVAHHFNRISNPNTGVMVLRPDPRLDELLTRTWEQRWAIRHPWWEQAALLSVLGYDVEPPGTCRLSRPSELLAGVGFLPTSWNSIQLDPAIHPRFKHYAGDPHAARVEAMTSDVAIARGRAAAKADAPAASIVVLALSAASTWSDILTLAEVPDDPPHEVVFVHVGAPDVDEVLARVSGSVEIVRPAHPVTYGGALIAGLSAATGELAMVVRGARQLDPGFVARWTSALADRRVSAVHAAYPTERDDVVAIAARRSRLLALEGVIVAAGPGSAVERLSTELTRYGDVLIESPGRPPALEPARHEIAGVRVLDARTELPALLHERSLFGAGAEIGVQNALFSEFLLDNWRCEKLISIDPWRAFGTAYDDIANVDQATHDRIYAGARERLARFGSRSEMWRMTSTEASERIDDHTLDFAYIDARHDFDAVLEDLSAWYGKVRPGGVLAGHDFLDGQIAAGDFGVRSAVEQFFGERGVPVLSTRFDGPYPSWYVVVPD